MHIRMCDVQTHRGVAAGPVHLVVDADAGLARLQRVGEAADLQHQQVHGLQHLLAVDHPVGQALQLAMAHGAREGARERQADRLQVTYCTGLADYDQPQFTDRPDNNQSQVT